LAINAGLHCRGVDLMNLACIAEIVELAFHVSRDINSWKTSETVGKFGFLRVNTDKGNSKGQGKNKQDQLW
jgi:hypothetical protein